MSAKRKGISQREAAAWKRRAIYAEYMMDPVAFTPGARRCIATFTITEAQRREWEAAVQFGAELRVERTGDAFEVFVYRDPNAPERAP